MISSILFLAVACIGDMLLVDVRPYYAYTDNVRGQTPVGYAYVVCLPLHKMDKLSVKIEGPQRMDAPPDGAIPVEFDGFVAKPYVDRNGRLAVTATATNIRKRKEGSDKAP